MFKHFLDRSQDLQHVVFGLAKRDGTLTQTVLPHLDIRQSPSEFGELSRAVEISVEPSQPTSSWLVNLVTAAAAVEAGTFQT